MENNYIVHPSLWMDTPGSQYPTLDASQNTDVLIIGAGIAGITTAVMLSNSGLSVTIIDSGEICAGTTGFSTAKITSLHGALYSKLISKYDNQTATLYAEANTEAIEKISSLVKKYEIDCEFTRSTAYTFTQSTYREEEIEKETAAANRAGLSAGLTTETELPFSIKAAVNLENQAYFNPRSYCLALVNNLYENGTQIYVNTQAEKLETFKSSVKVTANKHEINAKYVVVATHLPFVDKGMHFARLTPHRSYAIAVKLDTDYELNGMYVNIDEELHSLRPGPEGRIIVGGGGHRVGETPTQDPYKKISSWVKSNFGKHNVTHQWSTQDYMAPDLLPFIGLLSNSTPNTWTATGFSKWGMTNGTVAGQIIADKILGRKNKFAHIFDATRANLIRSLYSITEHNVKTAQHYACDKVKPFLQRSSYKEINNGSAAIVSDGASLIAAYRNEDGELSCVSANCTHMGCTVQFNKHERTWDCPCHGSRFAIDGTVLEGPAVKNLEKIEDKK